MAVDKALVERRFPTVSVIVPIYMIERYLGACIESILRQSYQNLEIVLVEDGGIDRCSEICDLFARKDERIKVVHKQNGGLVSARKAGLEVSTGEYISFVDGDDWIEPDFIEALIFAIKESGADIACAGHTRDLFGRSARFGNAHVEGLYESDDLIDFCKTMMSYDSFYQHGITTYLWNKLFKRKILEGPQLSVDDKISIGEDAAVTYPALAACESVIVVANSSYHYRQREDSMLKRLSEFPEEVEKLDTLYRHLLKWAAGTQRNLQISRQVVDYVLSLCIIRSGGWMPDGSYCAFGNEIWGKRVVVYSAGTFGQHIVARLEESKRCEIAGWIDDDYWEYRRGCLDVDPIEDVLRMEFDYILIATVNPPIADAAIARLTMLGVDREKVLLVTVPERKDERKKLVQRYLSKTKTILT